MVEIAESACTGLFQEHIYGLGVPHVHLLALDAGSCSRICRISSESSPLDAVAKGLLEDSMELDCWQPAQMGQLGAREIRGVEELGGTP